MFWKGKDKKNKLSLIILAVFIIALSFISVSNFALAQSASGNLAALGASAGLANTSLPTLLGNIVRVLLSLLGVAAVLIMLYAGFIWMTAGGDPGKVDKAKRIMVGGVIGLIIIVASFAIASFVMNAINGTGGGNSCDPSDTSEYSCNGCGVRTCQSNGTWGACSMQPSECGSDPFSSSQSTYINRFSDNNLNWQTSVRWNDSRIIGVPQSTSTTSGVSSLSVSGYAKNKGGTISGMNLWASSTNPWAILGAFQNVSTDVESLDNAYYPWDNASTATGTIVKLKILTTLSGLGTEIVSNPISTIIRARHCFDKIKNSDETKIDCGGECGGCAGESCESSSDCANGLCDMTTHTCMVPPHISSVSPYTEIGAVKLPNGAPGNYITILGNGFGTSSDLGSVNFLENITKQPTSAPLPSAPCPVIWTDNQIIAQIPSVTTAINHTQDSDIASNSSTNYSVMINNGLMDSDNQIGFQVNSIDRPGICSVSPNSGVYPSSTNIIGNKFTVDTSDVVWNLGALVGATWNNGKQIGGTWQNINSTSSAETNWTATTVTDVIPASGVSGNMAKIRVYNGENYSNNFLFTLSNGLEGSFCGGSDEGVCVAGDGA
ncbi:MAG: hypothetical protein WC244_02440, partial [Patescibacteria group bacterium]